uniref:RNA-directed RNA polymerase L n=1 Tax=Plasmopara viticola lesion associated mycobunyavirales-like virus 1 TaxID=2689124 RepID=A0A6B9HEQ5_9VIRU|nr:RNA dependent RNA polymerase [Plasmopara viticola lesion associated mycobunyavirales-like virus 1]
MTQNYYAEEQFRMITAIYNLLKNKDVIDLSDYIELSHSVGSGMMTKLRLVPEIGLKSRLSHLYAVCACALNEPPLFDEQIVVSVEGLNPSYVFDCDLILESSNKIYLIDFTADGSYENISNKTRILDNKRSDPSLRNKVVDTIVKVFEQKKFQVNFPDFSRDPKFEQPELFSLRLLDNLTRKSLVYNKEFIKQCDIITANAFQLILNDKTPPKNYNTINLTSDNIDRASSAAMSNNVSDILSLFSSITKKQYQPFSDSLKKITAQFVNPKEPFLFRETLSDTNETSLQDVLRDLSSDLLASVLNVSLSITGIIFGIKKNGEIIKLDYFPTSRTNNSMISFDSDFHIVAQHIKGHYFKILFSYEAMDDQLKRVIMEEKTKVDRTSESSKASLEKCLATIKEQETKLHEYTRLINKRITRESTGSIWDKIISLGRLVKSDSGNIGKTSVNLLNSICFALKNISAGNLISHHYEIIKTIAASIKNSHKGETYYVGLNGKHLSVTITKICSTQDSFDRTHYCTISRKTLNAEADALVRGTFITTNRTNRSQFRTIDKNEISYYLRLPYYITSLISWDIESSSVKGFSNKTDYPEKFANSILHCLVNRDTFSQAAQQVRYFYTSSIGYGADASKISDKIDFFRPKTTWEYIYVVRMIKLGFSLSVLRDTESLSKIQEDNELVVCFPHSNKPSRTFNHVISSMYYCNIFNKFRAFHEISEAYCFNELVDELKIYDSSRQKNVEDLAGLSLKTMTNIDNYGYLLSRDFITNETIRVSDLLRSGVGRFKASLPVIISLSNKYLKTNETIVKDIYNGLKKSPIEACTMRGSMKSGPATDKSQGIRAASAMLEELVNQYDIDPEKLNNNGWLHTVLMENIEKSGGDSSILTFVVQQLRDESIQYLYRIVQKDQIGNREISVLNAAFRLGALFTETVARTLSKQISSIDLLENSDKDYVFEKSVQHAIENDKRKNRITCYDNTDQKRWGPNHMLNFFSAMFYGSLHEERGLVKLLIFIADRTLDKEAKYPESLIRYFEKQTSRNISIITREGFNREHGSETLKTFFERHSNDLFNNIFSKKLPFGMCQGIFHSTSSVYHALLCKAVEDLVATEFGSGVSLKSFCTSDDSSRLISIDRNLHQISVIKRIHSFINQIGILLNIIRNESKSSFNFFISEFNSIFFKKGEMSTPSIKQRISKIDVGKGENHVEDYMASLSSSANYFAIGGSYSGCIILSVLNLALHTEQWNRWSVISNGKYHLPVELGGFPIIEPFTTCLSGAAANLYLRSSNYLSKDAYAKLFSSIITEKPEQYNLSDYFRIPKTLSEDSTVIKIYKNTGALGISSLVRTDKKLSQFEKRHKMSTWQFPDHFLTLRHQSCDSRFFLYNIYKNGCMSLFSESLGENSFYIRMSDPWISSERKCVRISKKSILTSLGLEADIRYSYNDIESCLSKVNHENAAKILIDFTNSQGVSEFNKTLIDQLKPRFDDALEIMNFILGQECAEYIVPKFKPATSRITLRGNEALDQEKYTADLIKVLAGERSRSLINEYFGDHRRFDELPNSVDCPNIPLKDSILIAENSIFAFNKYIKRNTKMITSGRPSTLSSLVTMTLRSRFFEGTGVRLDGTLELIGDRNHAFSYTSWYKRLSEKSEGYIIEKSNQTLSQLYSDVVKFGIISTNTTITEKDHFELSDSSLSSKHFKISCKSRSSLLATAKSWIGANVDCSFTYDSIQALFSNRLLSRNEFKISESAFSRNSTDIYFRIVVNNLPCIHLIESIADDYRTSYNHVILCESATTEAELNLETTDVGKSRSWITNIADFFSNKDRIYLNRTYIIRSNHGNDTVTFRTVDQSTCFDIDICNDTLTLALIAKDVKIPLGHVAPNKVTDVKQGYTLDNNLLISAVEKFSKLLDFTDELNDVSRSTESAISFILYGTQLHSKISVVNSTLRKIKFPIEFSNGPELDIFRSLLLDDKSTSKTINTTKFLNYVNNVFSTTTNKQNYLSELTIEDKLALKFEENELHEFDDEDLAPDEDFLEVQNNFEAFDNEDKSDSDSIQADFQDLDIDFDDVDFEALMDEEMEGEEDNQFGAFDIQFNESLDDETSLKTSRTGLTVNPNNEFPYQIVKFIKLWTLQNKLKNRIGIPRDYQSITHLAKAYLLTKRISGQHNPQLIKFLTGLDFVDIPCSLSDICILDSVVSS